MNLKPSECPLGYHEKELLDLLDEDGLRNFKKWMVGQTVTICEGRQYDHHTHSYHPTKCASNPHGAVYYRHDLERFLKHLPIID